MDRNSRSPRGSVPELVALRKESVDRNVFPAFLIQPGSRVALRKESVDRNSGQSFQLCNFVRSLSARRAWIEITLHQPHLQGFRVALRKESVDRNVNTMPSCSASVPVALRKESVDRNTHICSQNLQKIQSLSARRAWIEIC